MLREHGLADEHGSRAWAWGIDIMLMRSLSSWVGFEDAPET
jgi:hypothetical protein